MIEFYIIVQRDELFGTVEVRIDLRRNVRFQRSRLGFLGQGCRWIFHVITDIGIYQCNGGIMGLWKEGH